MISCAGEHDVDGVLERGGVEGAVVAQELEQVDRRRGCRPSRRRACTREHGFDALIRPVFGHVCQSLIVVSYWMPGSAQRQAASAISFIRSRALSVSIVSPLTRAIVFHSSPRSTASRNSSRHAHGVVRVLVLDRVEALAVDRHVEAGLGERRRLVLLRALHQMKSLDVRVVDVEHDHLGRAPRLAAGLDRAGPRVGAAHERHGPGGEAALGELLLGASGSSRG